MDIACIIAFLGWCVGGALNIAIGLGAALIAIPCMMEVMPPVDAVVASTFSCFTACSMITIQCCKYIDWRMSARILAGCIPGAVIGVLVLKVVPAFWILLGCGLMLAFFLVLDFKNRHVSEPVGWVQLPCMPTLFGVFAGFVQGAVGLGGPPAAALASMSCWEKSYAKAIFGMMFMPATLFVLLTTFFSDMYTSHRVVVGLWGLGGLAVGTIIGYPLSKWIPQWLFRLALEGIILVGAVMMFWKAFFC